MNFDVVEGLTQEQINKQYEEIIEEGSNKYLVLGPCGCNSCWYVDCDNGNREYFCDYTTQHPCGDYAYGSQYGCIGNSRVGVMAIACVCGEGNRGSTYKRC